MAMSSMTGFGRGEAQRGGIRVGVELSAVNRKSLDLRVNLPRALAMLEPRIQKLVGARITRGSITVAVTIAHGDAGRGTTIRMDMERAAGCIKAFRAAGRALELEDDLRLDSLLRIPDLLVLDDATRNRDQVWPPLREALCIGLDQLIAMRLAEGRTLEADIRKRLARLEKMTGQVARRAPAVARRYRRALEARIADMALADGPGPDLIAREVALFADRCDISEEIVRLASHFKQAATYMQRKEPSGRALDFLCQEMFREINTIGSKANDARLSGWVVEMKAELECIREQIQNIE